eukprot:Mycagemm_TRINITY_DN9388_c0_g1::TRINITY_DN9388_c0_g1_i2::g.3249::m.3249 type:complete len:127 gc:universal TRINITY_DN9388_c0_g1_i2:385-5(-)
MSAITGISAARTVFAATQRVYCESTRLRSTGPKTGCDLIIFSSRSTPLPSDSAISTIDLIKVSRCARSFAVAGPKTSFRMLSEISGSKYRSKAAPWQPGSNCNDMPRCLGLPKWQPGSLRSCHAAR